MKANQQMKRETYIQTAVVAGIIILINIIFQNYFFRLDLTKDKRYKLSQPTKELMKKIDDKIYVRVYLDGELPAGFRKLRESTRQLLEEIRFYSGKKLEFTFIDPLSAKNAEDQENIYRQLINEGLEPVNLEVRSEGKSSEKIIFPGAVVYYKEKSLPVKLLNQQIGLPPEQVIHNSITSLEFNFVNTFRKLSEKKKPSIAFIQGHGELDEQHTADIFATLSEYYDVKRINLPAYKVGVLDNIDLIIVAKPDSFFSELEKYKIDQFVVKGGKVIWLVETLLAELDSLGQTGYTSTMDYNLNLNDMFFNYGIRLNYNLVQDIQCHLIPLIINQGTPQQDFRPWLYFPLVFPENTHPIVSKLNAVLFQFANSIDTVGNKKIKKTVLLTSSPQSRLVYHPAIISLAETRTKPDFNTFNKGQQILAVLVEGKFNSLFRNRLSAETLNSKDYGNFVAEGKPTKMIFISDGDVISNQVSRIKEQIYPLGYDRFTKQTFGNKNLILNAADYLLDDTGILALRSKEYKLRLLDKAKIKRDKAQWQFVNLVLPIIVVMLFGLVFNIFRKYRYAGKQKI